MPFMQRQDSKTLHGARSYLQTTPANNGDVVQKCSSLSVAYLDVYSHQRAIAQIARKHHKL